MPTSAAKTRPVRSLVLSGGGARGAYEAGVLAYIFTELPRQLLAKAPINVLCGTSVGAIHACFLAAWAHQPDCNINFLLDVWRSFRLEKLLRLGMLDLLRLPWDVRQMFKGEASGANKDKNERGILLDFAVLQKLVQQDIPWEHLQANLNSGRVDAVTVSATHILSGKTVVFVDRPQGISSWTRDQRRVARATHIGPMHAMASAAIPLLFPVVRIDGAYYCDGALRQNTPLSPALRLGADRVLVVPVGHGREGGFNRHSKLLPVAAPDPAIGINERFPSPSLLAGKVLNALLLDHLDYDLAQLHGFNRLLEDGQRAFGDSFIDELSKTTERFRGAGYRPIDTVVVRPSRDLGEVATEFMDAKVLHHELKPLARWMLRWMSSNTLDKTAHHSQAAGYQSGYSNSDLLSYLLFDGRLTATLIDMGMADADAVRAQLIEFFTD